MAADSNSVPHVYGQSALQKWWNTKIKPWLQTNFASKSVATTSANGLMSAADKTRLDNYIAECVLTSTWNENTGEVTITSNRLDLSLNENDGTLTMNLT